MGAAIAALESRRAEALVRGDIPALRAMTHDRYIHIDARGQLRDKASYLASIQSGTVKMLDSRVIENHIVVQDRAAFVTGLFINEIRTLLGVELRSGRHSRAYVLEDGIWLNILHKGTEFRDATG